MQNYKSHQESLINGSIVANRKLIEKGGIVYSVTYGHLLGLQIYFSKNNNLDPEGYFFQSFRRLEKQLKMGEKTLRKYLKLLEKDGLLKIKRVKGKPSCYYKVTDEIFIVLKDSISSGQSTVNNAARTGRFTEPTEINTVDDGSFSGDPTELFPADYPQNLPPNDTLVNNKTLNDTVSNTVINESLSPLTEHMFKVIKDNREKLENNNIDLKQLVEVIAKSEIRLPPYEFEALINHLIDYAEPIRKTAVFVKTALGDIENIAEKYKGIYLKRDLLTRPIEHCSWSNTGPVLYNWLEERD